ncbi:hypothetical protein L873DRAFT_1847659 [Choiromyces venosus 120613-1]|uniref:Uncharacterized protein n=1 Tax=Choiromyces venosus 120613-1 TaxID=1336337 RepID=A0A3N4J693_9PEZI|nr:hypothetical protein L873DRAFT_1847659 [Choiromyces venosus 120613-1]
MEKLPPTPPRPPPSSSTLPASLPPRPPPAQSSVRKPITSVIPPALPMGPRPKKKFPAQGIGRGASTSSTPSPTGLQGHASLPLKPGIPGTPLPRETAAIVLAGGREGEEYSASKKTYQVVIEPDASSPNVHRNELATPQPRIMSPSDNVQRTQTPIGTTEVPSSIEQSVAYDPPGSSSYAGLPQQPSSSHQTAFPGPVIESNGQTTQFEHENLHQVGTEHGSIPNDGRSEFLFSNGHKSDIPDQVFSQHSRFSPNQQPQFYESTHTNSFQPNRHFHQFASHDIPPPSSHYSSFGPPHPGGPPPHHPHFFLSAQNQPQMFYPAQYPFPGNITPPNTGSLLPPMPPFQPQGTVVTSGHTSEVGSSTNPQTPFTPTHPFGMPPGLSHGPQPSYSPLAQPTEQTFCHEQPQDSSVFAKSQMAMSRQSSIVDWNPRLRNISFIAPSDSDEGAEVIASNSQQPHAQGACTPTHPEPAYEAIQPEEQTFPKHESNNLHVHCEIFTPADDEAAQRLQSYTLGYFLNKNLADVLLVVKQMTSSGIVVRQYDAHSFILARSAKLHDLFQVSFQKVDSPGHPAGNNGIFPKTSWADEMEHGNEAQDRSEFRNNHFLDGQFTLPLETNDGVVTQDSFLLALRSLYGAPDWELDAFLDPTHPQYRTLEWTCESSTERKPSTDNTNSASYCNKYQLDGSTRNEEVRMLERSIELFAAGHLLGFAEVIQKAIWGIRKWGMQLQGGAVERLLVFILEESEIIGDGNSPYEDLKSQLLTEVIEFLVHSLPLNFKLYHHAPPSQILCRFPKKFNQLPKLTSKPTPPPESQIIGIYSTIILSVPFNILKLIVEHENFGAGNKSTKKRYDDAKAIIHEREKRRKWGLRVSQGLSTENSTEKSGNEAENGNILHNASGHKGDEGQFDSVKGSNEQKDPQLEDLYWEEGTFYAIGGQNGVSRVEINRKKKVPPTVGALWRKEG